MSYYSQYVLLRTISKFLCCRSIGTGLQIHESMFESLTERMVGAIRNIRGLNKLTEDNIAQSLKEVRTALLSADVHFKVARDFVDGVKEKCLGRNVIQAITPGQLIVKIIHDELVTLLGEGSTEITEQKPLKVMLVGLHGAGKTTTTVKLARLLRSKGYKPMVVACDVYRPAAVDQLVTLSREEQMDAYCEPGSTKVLSIAKNALKQARDQGNDAILFDTAGRLQVDEALVQEVKDLRKLVDPNETLLVADSALGQEAVNVAKTFHEAVHLTGIVLTKLDGDARGGAALSMKAITQVPIKFMGVGEKLADFEVFHPDRMAQRILGMGDVVSLVEKAEEHFDQDQAAKLEAKFKKAEFDFEDYLAQLEGLKKLGSLSSLAKMMPGLSTFKVGDREENKFKRTEAIIKSMTLQERRRPQLINGSRRMRIARGSGVEVKDVNQVLKEFQMMQKMMRTMKGGKAKKMMQKLSKQMGGGNQSPFPGLPF